LTMGMIERVLTLFGWIMAGMVVYFGGLVVFGLRFSHISLKA